MFFDFYYLILVVPAILLSLWAQTRVTSTYQRYSRVMSRSGYTGAQIARRILDENGLTDVSIEAIDGELTDHYDPRTRVVRLSRDVYFGGSVASLGVAAHETGHAVQHAEGYFPLQIRTAIIPVTNFGAKLSMPLLLLGFFLGIDSLVSIGILLFSLMTVFQFITLPVEFNASTRAMDTLSSGVLTDDELDGTRQVLSAAALTYVAALLVSAMQLLRLILVFGNRRRR
jgi:hypothetical protein